MRGGEGERASCRDGGAQWGGWVSAGESAVNEDLGQQLAEKTVQSTKRARRNDTGAVGGVSQLRITTMGRRHSGT